MSDAECASRHEQILVVQAQNRLTGSDYYIEVLFNGVRVELPGCHDDEGLCSLEAFLVCS